MLSGVKQVTLVIFERLDLGVARLGSIDNRLASIEGNTGSINNRLALIEENTGSMNTRLASIEENTGSIDNRLASMDSTLKENSVLLDDIKGILQRIAEK